MNSSPEILVAPWMRAQHGLVTRAQALVSGVSSNQIEWRLRGGLWIPAQRGVYRLPSSPEHREQRIHAAILAVDGETVASHRSAAWLWGLISPAAARVEVTTLCDRRVSLPSVVVHRTRRHLGWAKIHGIRVTSPVVTIIDLAGHGDTELVQDALDRGSRKHLITGADILAELDRSDNRGVDGTRRLRAILAERGFPGVPSSVLERRTVLMLRKGGVRDPVRELPTGPFRIDFVWLPEHVMLEVDGFETHGTPEALQADLARQNDLVARGWIPLRYTWRDVCQRPGEIVEEVKRMLQRASASTDLRLPATGK